MKPFLLIVTAALLFHTFGKCQSNDQHDHFSEEQVTKMLNTFYTNYITALTKATGTNENEVDSLLNRYCTLNLLNEIRFAWTYYPLLKINSSNTKILESLSIKKDSKHDDVYHVSYLFENKKTTIKLIIVKKNERYKIDYVWLDWSEDYSDEQITKMLRTFYRAYITEFESYFSKVDTSKGAKPIEDKIDSILNRYCTTNLIKEKEDAWDYDPIIKGQMIDIRMLDHLTVRKDLLHKDIYYVSYLYGDGKTTIKLIVINHKGRYKIDYLWLD